MARPPESAVGPEYQRSPAELPSWVLQLEARRSWQGGLPALLASLPAVSPSSPIPDSREELHQQEMMMYV
eukprot:2132230-Rhodomonas_salina.1